MTTDPVTETGAWLVSPRPRPDAPVRLLAIPHAGGSAASYARWSGLLPAEVDVAVVQLPGRHDRRAEPVFTDVERLVEALYDAVEEQWDGRPFALFGHSMGAVLAYRLTVLAERLGGPYPMLLAVSGWAPCAHRHSDRPIASLSDDEVLDVIGAFGAVPPELAADPQMRALTLPALRGDLSVLDDFHPDGATVTTPVVAYSGADDPALPPGTMAEWGTLTGTFLGATTFPGDHFYLFPQAVSLSADLSRHLRDRTPRG
jgi:surfactin synthase thioesterase subunit